MARANKDFHRVQMDLPPSSMKRLEHLKEVTEASSYAEVAKQSFRLYEWVIKQLETGSEIQVCKDGNTISVNDLISP